ncbi:hypothetical protein [Streptomyces sp. JJ38]|uniref:hypothetical protein n=1 Tax=Streptomyces sp. JJ38 TaxID=2738128 RepID=UPI001C56C6A9|nr:hypothetical protein [Streptomyces sp. JJ38]MBW1596663.1 hypothetical protein [Streptomyces sp. JJ38]
MTSRDDARRRPTGPSDDARRAARAPLDRAPSTPQILDAAAAPPTGNELRGEEAALAAFRAARDARDARDARNAARAAGVSPASDVSPTSGPGSSGAYGASVRKPGLRGARRGRGRGPWKRGTVLALAGVALLTGGVTAAAVSGGLPFTPSPPSAPAAPESGAPVTKPPAATGRPTAPGEPDTTATPPGSAPAEGDSTAPGRNGPPEAVPSRAGQARLAGLCHAYLQLPEHRRAQALTTSGFQPLVHAAGGPDAVHGYCDGQPPAAPGPPGSPLPPPARAPHSGGQDATGTPSASAPPGDAERAADTRTGGPGTPSEPDDAGRDRGQGRP